MSSTERTWRVETVRCLEFLNEALKPMSRISILSHGVFIIDVAGDVCATGVPRRSLQPIVKAVPGDGDG